MFRRLHERVCSSVASSFLHFYLIIYAFATRWQDGVSVAAVSRRLVREAVRERRCKDNCTAIVIAFNNK